jgi:DNA invertase Pin-like site-specific DNA recombinase
MAIKAIARAKGVCHAYIRVSTDSQFTENQRFEILKFADSRRIKVDKWIEETVSGRARLQDRLLFQTLRELRQGDILVTAEISRLGRNLMEVMSMLHECMERQVKVYTIKEGYELGDNINSKVLAFAFGLSAEIERNLISQRTREALARRKSEGKPLGRPFGSLNSKTKLTGREDQIRLLLKSRVSHSAIARIMGVNRLTVRSFVKSRGLDMPEIRG